ncbi:MAG: hypothetical protein J5986_08200 [Roseburia sp.]|nr:hypothetical protein [Roseburia sp.]
MRFKRGSLRNEEKHDLVNLSLDILGDIYPRIIKINYSSGEGMFIKDRERLVAEPFEVYNWQVFLEKFLETVHPDDRERCAAVISLENMKQIYEKGSDNSICRYRRKYGDDYKWMQSTIIPVKNYGESNCVFIFAKNIDNYYRKEEIRKAELQQALREAREAEAVKTEFLQYMSHDLRTPMNAVLGMSALAIDAVRKRDTEKTEYYLEHVHRMGEYMASMLNDILEVSRMKKHGVVCRREVFSMEQFLDDCREYARAKQQNRKIDFTCQVEEELEETYLGDSIRMEQVLYNLISNAFKFNREPGSVRLQVRLAERNEKTDFLEFCVEDTGVGIDAEFMETMFETFTKERQLTSDNHAGLGVGLSMVKLVTEALGGTIRAESEKQVGSRFYVTVPLERVK